jgi:RNA polymerase sigma-70 factor, ECF subfamily
MDLDSNRKLLSAALGRIAAGERAALQTVYRLTSAKLFSVCLRILGERAEAEDALQEVYMTVWRKAAKFDPDLASPMAWLIAIARNRAIDLLRARGRSRRLEPLAAASELPDDAPLADTDLQNAQERSNVLTCLERLVDRERVALRGAFFDGCTYEELADRMKVPLGTMKSWIRRALLKLKTCLEEHS